MTRALPVAVTVTNPDMQDDAPNGLAFVLRELLPYGAAVVGLLIGMFMWANYPMAVQVAAIAIAVLAAVYGLVSFAVRFGPTPEAMAALTMSGRDVRDHIRASGAL